MPPRYRLRRATEADYAFLQAVGHEGLRPQVEPLDGWDRAAHQRAFRAAFNPSRQQVVEVGGEPVGYLHVVPQPGHTLLAGLYLHAAWRNRGLGGAVLAAVCREADRERRTPRLRVHRGSPAERLYARHGFHLEHETDLQRQLVRRPRPPEEQP